MVFRYSLKVASGLIGLTSLRSVLWLRVGGYYADGALVVIVAHFARILPPPAADKTVKLLSPQAKNCKIIRRRRK